MIGWLWPLLAGLGFSGVVTLLSGASGRLRLAVVSPAATRPSRAGAARGKRTLVDRRKAVPEVAFALAAELRAGRSFAAALAASAAVSGPLAATIEAAVAAERADGSAVAVLEHASQLPGASGLRAVATVWQAGQAGGVAVAELLDRVGESLLADNEAVGRLDALLAGPRATAWMLAALPVFGVGLGQTVGAHPLALLLHQPLGWALAAGALLFDLVGVAWVRAIVSRATPP